MAMPRQPGSLADPLPREYNQSVAMNTLRRPQGLIAMIRRVQTERGRRLSGLYSIEGTRLVERAVRAGAPLVAVLAAEGLLATPTPRLRELLAALSAAGCPVTPAPDAVMADLTEGRDLGQLLCLVGLPPPVSLPEVLSSLHTSAPTTAAFPTLLLAAVDITDPGNVGALTRTAHAAGAAALLVAGGGDPFHPRATRISRGSIFKLPVVTYADAAALLADLRGCGVAAIATTVAGGVPLPHLVRPAGPVAVLMGNEAEGLPADVAAAVDISVTIPMPAGVDSYSVNAAAAIVLYHLGQASPA